VSGRGDHDPEFFDWQGIRIYQHESVHKVGTDAVLLGSWVATILSDPKFILDAGTGSGILALMMAKSFPFSIVHAMDIDRNSIELTSRSVNASEYGSRITILCEDILEMDSLPASLFDLIVSNPPFYTEHIRPALQFKQRAKHIKTSEAHWIKSFVSRLNPDGQLCIVVPFESAKRWIYAANENGYYNQHRLDVFSFVSDPFPKRSLLHFTHDLIKPRIDTLAIYNAENEYTQNYLKFTGIRLTT
jgi:tRNA1Val (adenine37-N6)-methyltransferase